MSSDGYDELLNEFRVNTTGRWVLFGIVLCLIIFFQFK